MTIGQAPLVIVLKTLIETLEGPAAFPPLQASVAVGGSKAQVVPQLTVLFVEQTRNGGVVSTTFTV
jgi:hypothetical protein